MAGLLAVAGTYYVSGLTGQRPVAAPAVTEVAATAATEVAEVVYRSDARIEFASPIRLNLSGPAAPPQRIKSLLSVGEPIQYGEYVWDDDGVPTGPLWVYVDLTAQTMSVFRGNHEIGATVFVYGADEKPSPTGRFTVLEMRKDHWSRTYDAPMPYTLRLTDDGVAVHGSNVRRGAATHGCLGVPLEFAKLLFAEAEIGDEVFITRTPLPTSSPA